MKSNKTKEEQKYTNDFSRYNDYELIYYAKEHDEEAWNTLIWKYSFLIRSRIKLLKVPYNLHDDFYQEGCLMLLETINLFDDSKNTSFTNFFDLLLTRKFISLMRKEYSHSFDLVSIEQIDLVSNSNNKEKIKNELHYLKEQSNNDFSGLEKVVFDEIIIKGRSNKELSDELEIDVKKIYNAKQRVLKKIKKTNNI